MHKGRPGPLKTEKLGREVFKINIINSIELTNFQSHQSSIIEPAPAGKLTVITGPSDSGKTAIIRALKWLLYNAPQGADFMRTGARAVKVAVKYANRQSGDGANLQTVSRERTAATNRYRLIESGGAEPVVLEGFGNAVPLEVQQVTGVKTVKIADQELTLNLSEQLDPPFLGQKSTTAPGRAKILGKLAGTEELDVAGADVGRDVYRTNRDVKALEAEIDGAGGLAEQIAGFDWIEGLGERIAAIERVLETVRRQQERLATLKGKREKLVAVDGGIVAALTVLDRWSVVLPKAGKIVAAVAASVDRYVRLLHLEDRLIDVRAGIDRVKQVLRRWAGVLNAEKAVGVTGDAVARCAALKALSVKLVDVGYGVDAAQEVIYSLRGLSAAEEVVSEAEEMVQRAGGLVLLKWRLKGVAEDRERFSRDLQQWKNRLPGMEQDYFDELMRVGVCPTCGGTDFDILRIREVV